MSTVGVAITTYNRRDLLEQCIANWRKFHDGPLVVVDDGSDEPVPQGLNYENVWHKTNRGISAAKNSALQVLEQMGVDHMFLSDDDTWPTRPDWAERYVEGNVPFLIHGFESGPSHWQTTPTQLNDSLISWDKPRGCLLYVYAPDVLPIVGGLHNAFGKHGGEHGDWAERAYQAGLTPVPHLSLVDSPFYCLDEDHPNISSVSYGRQWEGVDASRLPLYAEYKDQDIPVLVPRRNDHGHRDRMWRWVQDAFWERLRGFKVVEGHHVEGPFNRSLALNLASELAGNWEVAIIADSDAWVPARQLEEAVDLARQENRLVAAFTEVHEVSQHDTFDLLSGNTTAYVGKPDKIRHARTVPLETQSMMIVVPRNTWEQVRGFDPKHVGWGSEDCSFWIACSIATGEPLRVPGPVYSLWHKPSSREHHSSNIRRWEQYCQARTLEDIHRLRA